MPLSLSVTRVTGIFDVTGLMSKLSIRLTRFPIVCPRIVRASDRDLTSILVTTGSLCSALVSCGCKGFGDVSVHQHLRSRSSRCEDRPSQPRGQGRNGWLGPVRPERWRRVQLPGQAGDDAHFLGGEGGLLRRGGHEVQVAVVSEVAAWRSAALSVDWMYSRNKLLLSHWVVFFFFNHNRLSAGLVLNGQFF